MNVSEKYSNQEIFNSSENSIRKYLGHILRTYLRWREQHGKMWGIIFHGYQDMSQGKGNISVRCQMRGKIYKRPIQRGANAKIRHTHIQRLNSEKYVLSVLTVQVSWESFTESWQLQQPSHKVYHMIWYQLKQMKYFVQYFVQSSPFCRLSLFFFSSKQQNFQKKRIW